MSIDIASKPGSATIELDGKTIQIDRAIISVKITETKRGESKPSFTHPRYVQIPAKYLVTFEIECTEGDLLLSQITTP